MENQAIAIVSIHDTKNSVLACDLREALDAVREFSDRWIWCISCLDAFGVGEEAGQEVQRMCERVENSNANGVWLSTEELEKLSRQINQTIDGEFIAFPRRIHKTTLEESDVSVAAFPTNAAELVISIVDSTYVEIYSKNDEIIAKLRAHFHDVRDEDPRQYFGAA